LSLGIEGTIIIVFWCDGCNSILCTYWRTQVNYLFLIVSFFHFATAIDAPGGFSSSGGQFSRTSSLQGRTISILMLPLLNLRFVSCDSFLRLLWHTHLIIKSCRWCLLVPSCYSRLTGMGLLHTPSFLEIRRLAEIWANQQQHFYEGGSTCV
jgi:hypothetical protein